MLNSTFISSGNYVTGPSASTINSVALWDDVGGTLLKNSNLIADVDTGNLTIPGNLNTKYLDLNANNHTFTLQGNSLQTNDIILTLPANLGNSGDALILGNNGTLQFSPVASGNVSTLENTVLHAYYVPVWDIGVNRQLITHGIMQITTNDQGAGNIDTNVFIDCKGNASTNVYIGENSASAGLYVFGIATIEGDLICNSNISCNSLESSFATITEISTNSLILEDTNNNQACILKTNGVAPSPITWFLPLTMPVVGQSLKVINVFTNPNQIYLGWA